MISRPTRLGGTVWQHQAVILPKQSWPRHRLTMPPIVLWDGSTRQSVFLMKSLLFREAECIIQYASVAMHEERLVR